MNVVVREATQKDVTPLVRLVRQLQQESEWSWLPFSPAAMRKSIQQMMRRPDFIVLVSEVDGELKGLLFGMVDKFLYNQQKYATDVEFSANRAGAKELLSEFRTWAEAQGAVVRIHAVSSREESDQRTKAKDRWFQMQGLERTGGMFQERLR